MGGQLCEPVSLYTAISLLDSGIQIFQASEVSHCQLSLDLAATCQFWADCLLQMWLDLAEAVAAKPLLWPLRELM